MKKTTVIMAIAGMLMYTGVMANENVSTLQLNETQLIVKLEISTFCKAILKGDVDLVRGMIEAGEDVNKISAGMTPAIFAARYNRAEILELLIANGANLRIKCKNGLTITEIAQASNATDALALLKKEKKAKKAKRVK
ncbi:ankyrin repeat protein [Maribacter vaceletii]|uniref:Ankyrin repeat protein n=1 Tax=Maribacter vaceletii TaxID=1206816 RepID=A0A495DT97_9FLAO|nr:ankyrin repeat domain-containing protein [Maribacter vaceletii]RKR07856.1 ankyrin repeat protein [Maribacter vaceletii]